MEEIKEGEYVRTKTEGIGKIIHINTHFADENYKKVLLGNNKAVGFTSINDIKKLKHSPNIIDLIEEGDYVNGKRVIYVASIENKYDEEELCVFVEETQDCIEARDIKTILTKEQYEEHCYKIEV